MTIPEAADVVAKLSTLFSSAFVFKNLPCYETKIKTTQKTRTLLGHPRTDI